MPKSSVKTALVTGAAGFIGHATCARLLSEGWQVVGIDNLNAYYDPKLKKARLKNLADHKQAKNFTFKKLDLTNLKALTRLALATKPSVIIHFAAQAGVRYGITHQTPYLESNLIGHFHILQVCKALADAKAPIAHLLYASSSSIYGANEKFPFEETDDVSRPVSLYAATKRADELLTHAFAHQFTIPSTGMRFFTVYGPWGRPDMTPLMFTEAVYKGKPIKLFNKGDLWRDFTYIDDIVEAIVRLIPYIPAASSGKNMATPHTIFNLGNQNPVRMDAFVKTLEKITGRKAKIKLEPWPSTEVYKTAASTAKLKQAIGWAPSTPLEDGLARLNDWYRQWARVK